MRARCDRRTHWRRWQLQSVLYLVRKISTRTQTDPVHTGRHSGQTTVKQTQVLKQTHVRPTGRSPLARSPLRTPRPTGGSTPEPSAPPKYTSRVATVGKREGKRRKTARNESYERQMLWRGARAGKHTHGEEARLRPSLCVWGCNTLVGAANATLQLCRLRSRE